MSIENLSGEGELYRGNEHLGRVSYWITVSQKMLPVGGGDDSGTPEIIGHLMETGNIDLVTLSHRGGGLTLQLEDGRKWDCFLRDSDGRLANRDVRDLVD
jgi:hypothetical protein